MVGLGTIRLLPAALVTLVLVSASGAQDTTDFKFYPKKAQDCMYDAADSSRCESATVVATNSCFCRNGGKFITTAAACIARSSPGDLREVYRTMRDACDNSDTPITMTEDEFMEAAEGDSSTTTTTRRTSTTTSASATDTGSTTATTTGTTTGTAATTAPPPTSTTGAEEPGSSGLSTGAVAGVIAGAVGGCAVLGAIGFFLFRQRKKAGEESHPMLPHYPPPHEQQHQQHHLSMAPSGRESTAYYGSPPSTTGWPKQEWVASPDARNSTFTWESPSHLSYLGGGPLAPSPPPPIQELDGAQHFPPGSAQAPAEMGGTPVDTAPSSPPPPPAPAPALGPAPANAPQYQPYNPPQPYPGPAWSQQHR